MNDPEIEQRLILCRKKFEATAALLKRAKVDWAVAIGALKIENEILKGTYKAMRTFHDLCQIQGRSHPSGRSRMARALNGNEVMDREN